MKKWIFVIVMTATLSFISGCADTADADDSKNEVVSTDVGTDTEVSGDTIWVAIVLTWQPINRTIDKEFASEVACWNYYESGVGESKFGTQVLDHQGNPPDKEYMKKHRPSHREYPIRLYHGITDEQGQVWLTCDIKGRYEDL